MSTTTRNHDRGIAIAAAIAGFVACGVQDHPHEQAVINTDDDLGATGSGAGGTSPITTGPAVTAVTVGTTGGPTTTVGSATTAGSGGSAPIADASPTTGAGGSAMYDAQGAADAIAGRDAGPQIGRASCRERV